MILWKSKNERRQEPRAKRPLKARIRVWDAAGQAPVTSFHDALVINISKKGLCLGLASLSLDGLHLTHCLQYPDEYLLGLDIIPPVGDPWQVTAELKWINRQMGAGQFSFRLGAVFQKPLPDDWRQSLGGKDAPS
jgi:hypothetical protein